MRTRINNKKLKNDEKKKSKKEAEQSDLEYLYVVIVFLLLLGGFNKNATAISQQIHNFLRFRLLVQRDNQWGYHADLNEWISCTLKFPTETVSDERITVIDIVDLLCIFFARHWVSFTIEIMWQSV